MEEKPIADDCVVEVLSHSEGELLSCHEFAISPPLSNTEGVATTNRLLIQTESNEINYSSYYYYFLFLVMYKYFKLLFLNAKIVQKLHMFVQIYGIFDKYKVG
jgi:hypothetical protein